MSTISSGAESATNPKLPLGETIGLSYSTYFHYFSDVLRTSWLWLVLATPLIAATGWLQATWLAQAMANAASDPSAPVGFAVLGNISSLAFMFAGVSIAVAWHRRLLLDETPGFSGSNVATGSLWRYIGVGIAICLIVALPAAVILIPTFLWLLPHMTDGNNGPPNPAVFPLILVIYGAAFAVMLRLSPLLPARAIGDLALNFKQVWNRTRGNTWRIFWGIVACSTPPILALEIIYLVLAGFPDPQTIASGEYSATWAVTAAIFSCCSLLLVPIWIGFLSHAYRYFFNPAQTDTHTP